MNKHELFDLIGEADEAYVNAADAPAKRARPRWRTWAACAACAALIIGAYPAYRALAPTPLHGYTVVEGNGGGSYDQSTVKTPGGDVPGQGAPDVPPAPNPESDPVYAPSPTDPPRGSGPDAPVEEGPYNQYNNLFENARLDEYPEWYGGAYNNYEDGVPVKLVVCIVDGFHTPELEAQITDWCGGELIFKDVKYSRGYLQSLMERMNGSEFLAVTKEDPAVSGCGVYEQDNCIRMDCRAVPNDATLAALARLDPDGDAIQVRVFSGQTVNTDIVKGPAPGGAQKDQPQADPDEPSETPPDGTETAAPAQYDAQPALLTEPPEAEYDLLPPKE